MMYQVFSADVIGPRSKIKKSTIKRYIMLVCFCVDQAIHPQLKAHVVRKK